MFRMLKDDINLIASDSQLNHPNISNIFAWLRLTDLWIHMLVCCPSDHYFDCCNGLLLLVKREKFMHHYCVCNTTAKQCPPKSPMIISNLLATKLFALSIWNQKLLTLQSWISFLMILESGFGAGSCYPSNFLLLLLLLLLRTWIVVLGMLFTWME